MRAPRISIIEVHDGQPDIYDFTPDDRRERCRQLTVAVEGKAERTEVVIAELERDDPTTMYFAINFRSGLPKSTQWTDEMKHVIPAVQKWMREQLTK